VPSSEFPSRSGVRLLATLALIAVAAMALVPQLQARADDSHCPAPKATSHHQRGSERSDSTQPLTANAIAAGGMTHVDTPSPNCDHCATAPCTMGAHCGTVGAAGTVASLLVGAPAAVAGLPPAVAVAPPSRTSQPPTPPPDPAPIAR
jgi:hypothetical protein